MRVPPFRHKMGRNVNLLYKKTSNTPKSLSESDLGGLDKTGFFERRVSAVFVHRLESLCGELYFHVAAEFRNPDTLSHEIWRKCALYLLHVVETDAAVLLGETLVNDFTTALGAGSGDAAYPCHD